MFPRSTLIASLLLVGSFVHVDTPRAQGQLPRARDTDAPAAAAAVLEGIVLEPDGAPAVGAVVVTSAGGKAVTELDGSFRLEVELPSAAESLEITAVAGAGANGRMVARRLFSPTAPGSVGVEPLLLTLGNNCLPGWPPTFGKDPGVNGSILAMAVFDDGGGPALFAGGDFSTAGGQLARVARWDGSSWAPVLSAGTIKALFVFDDGSGPALYAGGNQLREWDGSNWSPLGSVAKWDGSNWSPLGSVANAVIALAVFDDGSGPALYAGGSFTTAGGAPANYIAKWDGTSWSSLGSGLGATVNALAVYDGVGGPALYAGGYFTSAGGAPANHIAKWNGTSWSALGTGMNGPVNALAVFDDGSGPSLYSGSQGGPHYIARWNGAGWSSLHGGMDDWVQSFAVFDAGDGPALYAGGRFKVAGGVPVSGFARWSEGAWSALERGLNAPVRTLAVYDDGSGPALYVGGGFTGADGVLARGIAKWDGSSWAPLGLGLGRNDSNDVLVTSMAVFDDGSGPGLYVGGGFDTAGAVAVKSIARWDGSSWSRLGNEVVNVPNAMAVFDDGSGPALYVGVKSLLGNCIRKWDGANWSGLAGGDVGDAPYPDLPAVYALTVYDDGNGQALYVGGEFERAGSLPTNGIARWDGASWSALGAGFRLQDFEFPLALAVFDDGNGPALYAGGNFTNVGGSWDRNYIARWDGSSWSGLGSGMSGYFSPFVHALTVFDDGSGSALYAGGDFTVAGGVAANGVARWDGSNWSALGGGVSGSIFFDYQQDKVAALCVFPNRHGRDLFVGGTFGRALDSGDSFLARWQGCLTTNTTKVRRR